jgi:Lon protease-like protein
VSITLPLFPLQTVLFPGAFLPLHIFEPRYRQLLADLTQADPASRAFGLLPVGAASELPAAGTIGCEARLRGVQPLPDGRANIVVSGERRFEFLTEVPTSAPYHEGLVLWIEDVPEVQVPAPAEIERLRLLGERYVQARLAMQDRTLDVELPADPGRLTFAVAAYLDWEFEALRRFLEIRSVSERVTRLLSALPMLVAGAEARSATHARARGNGHGPA